MEVWVCWYKMRYYRIKQAYRKRKEKKQKQNIDKTPSWMAEMYSELREIQKINGTSIYLIS